jgi:hypothetical protein
LADEDPLNIRIRASLDEQVFGSSSRRLARHKKVHYTEGIDESQEKRHRSGVVKEEIEIPIPGLRRISKAEHWIAAIMSGGERQMHGLTGKPLVYERPPRNSEP